MTVSMQQEQLKQNKITLENIPLEHIEVPTVDVRNGLRTSIENLGQRVAVKLRRKEIDGSYEIIDGKHRIAVAIDLGLPTIRAEVEVVGTTQADNHDKSMELLVANAVRERNMGSEAEAVASLLGDGYTTDDISKRTGIPLRTIKELEDMKKGLVPEAFLKVTTGEIARGTAYKMLRLTPVRQQDLIAEVSAGKDVTAKDADAAVKDQRNDMLDRLDKVRPKATANHTQLGQAVQMVAAMYAEEKQRILLDAAAILRGE